MRRAGACETSSITVASADGPASAGIASGTISGSPCSGAASGCSEGKIMRSAIKNSTTAPAICSDRSLRFIRRKKPSPTNMKVSSSKKAISTSRRMTHMRRSGATPRKALTKIGMLPNGSVISSSKTVADAKVYVMGSGCRQGNVKGVAHPAKDSSRPGGSPAARVKTQAEASAGQPAFQLLLAGNAAQHFGTGMQTCSRNS